MDNNDKLKIDLGNIRATYTLDHGIVAISGSKEELLSTVNEDVVIGVPYFFNDNKKQYEYYFEAVSERVWNVLVESEYVERFLHDTLCVRDIAYVVEWWASYKLAKKNGGEIPDGGSLVTDMESFDIYDDAIKTSRYIHVDREDIGCSVYKVLDLEHNIHYMYGFYDDSLRSYSLWEDISEQSTNECELVSRALALAINALGCHLRQGGSNDERIDSVLVSIREQLSSSEIERVIRADRSGCFAPALESEKIRQHVSGRCRSGGEPDSLGL